MGVGLQLRLDRIPGLAVDDGLMLARVAGPLVVDLAHIERVCENPVQMPAAERLSTPKRLGDGVVRLALEVETISFGLQGRHGAVLEIEPVKGADDLSLALDDDEGAVL